jgi:5-methylcytosine-specific restriction endonuclease McrA
MSEQIGYWQERVRSHPPHQLRKAHHDSLIRQIRKEAKGNKYRIQEGESCFVCAEDILEVLRKHHLVLVAAYPLRTDLNDHIITLCENCHDLAHRLVYGERGGITWKTVQKLKEAGYWDKFVELDKMAALALQKIEDRSQMRLAL